MNNLKLTRGTFEDIAYILARQVESTKDGNGYYVWACVRTELADYFENCNPNFDRAKFLRACNPEA